MAVLLPDTLKTMTENFPAAEAKDVEITLTGGVKKRLQKAYEDGDLGGGEGLMVVETMPANPEPGETVMYVGEDTASYKNGHFYKNTGNIYRCYAYNSSYCYIMNDFPPTTTSDIYAASGWVVAADENELSIDTTHSIIDAALDGSSITLDNDDVYELDNEHTLDNRVWEDVTPEYSTVISIKSLSELPADSEIPENLEKGNIYILSQNDNGVKAGTMFSVGATEPSSTITSTYHYKFTNGIKTIYSSASTIGANAVYIQSDNGYLFTSLVNISGNTYRPALYEDDTSGVWDFNVNLPSTDEAVPTIAGWVALNEDTTTELAEQALAVASAASLQAKEAKDAITPHFTGTRNEVNAQIAQNKLPDGAYVAVTDDIDQDYDTDYSTNEIKLANRWIDGKPIYRKVMKLNTPVDIPSQSWYDIPNPPTDVGTVITLKVIKELPDQSAYWNMCGVTNLGRLWNDRAETLYSVNVFVMEYTKSTD